MKSTALFCLIGLAVAMFLWVPGCTGYNNRTQTGPAQAGAGEKPGVYAEADKTLFGTRISAHLTTEGTFRAKSITFNASTTQKALDIEEPILEPKNIVEETNAATGQIANGMLPMSKEYTAWSIQLGDHAVKIVDSLMNPLNILASAAPILVGGQVALQLPEGVQINGKSILYGPDVAAALKSIADGMVSVVQTVKATPASKPAASQPSP